jgi:O-antigen/teichoic acid export membrane protein
VPRSFSIDVPVAALDARTARGSIVLIAAQGLKSLAMFVAGAYLSRLVLPAAYGVSALITSILGVLLLISDFGLGTAAVQRQHLTERQLSTLFWLNVGLGALLMLLGLALSPLIASSFADNALRIPMMAMCPLLLLFGLRHQHLSLLSRRLQFGRIAAAELFATAIGIAVAVVAARRGLGVYALIAQALATSAAETLFIWFAAAWLPGRPALTEELREVLSFGGHLSAFQLLHYATRNADNLLIGRFIGAYELGLYSRAYGIMMLPHVAITLPLQRVLIAALARLQHDRRTFDATYVRAVSSLAALSFPFGAGLCVLAEEAIAVVLGPNWLPAVPLLRVLAIAAMLQPILHALRWAFLGLGKARQLLYFSLLTAPLLLGSCIVGLPWGAFGVAAAYSGMAYAVVLPLGLFYASRGLGLRVTPLLHRLVAPLLASGLMAVAVYGLRLKLVANSALPLLLRTPILVGVGVAAYALFLGLMSPEVFTEAAHFFTALRKSDVA